MKKLLLCMCGLLCVVNAESQIANWTIPASYDNIRMIEGADLIITDSLNYKTIWTYDGKRLATTTNLIYPFAEGLAVSTDALNVDVKGFYRLDGSFVGLDKLQVARNYPYFSFEKLLVRNGEFYSFVDVEGRLNQDKFAKAYPFFNGYASCVAFKNIEKRKDPFYFLISTDNMIVSFSFVGKKISLDDVEFVSSVNDENVGIVVVDRKVYFFNGEDRTLWPVFDGKEEQKAKNQAKIEKNIEQSLVQDSDTTHILTAKCGKTGRVSLRFDKMMRPVSIIDGEQEYVYKVKEKAAKVFVSPMKIMSDKTLFGLNWDGTEMLPAQFDAITTLFDNKAFVKLNGKFGMLSIDKDSQFRIKMNKGNDVAFLHQKFETSVRVDMPTEVSANNVFLELKNDEGCELDKTSREYKNTESGNFVEYNCTLTIPSDLPDTITTISYPFQVLYDRLKSPIISHNINAWHYKKFEIEEDESQRHVENGNLSFVFNVKTVQSDGNLYPTDVNVTADTLQVMREDKMSETRYKYRVEGLQDGINNIIIYVTEKGCPPVKFPYIVEYHKPVEKNRRKSAPETVTITPQNNKMILPI